MLDFFRRYQRYLYIVITIVIVISFSFFGTYSTINTDAYREQIDFTAVDGTPIPRSELDQMVMFISTDADDKLFFGGAWGPNFLNDGVIKKDFLQNGLGLMLANQFPGDINIDIEKKLIKEKRFVPYVHPQAHFLNADTAWNYFAPDLKKNFDALRASSTAASPESLAFRVNLYLAQQKMPPPFLRHILLSQQKQYSWLAPDPNLERADLSLFGYHTLDDWFGPRFIRLISEFIINSAIIAEQQGYEVTRAEALADLKYNSEISFRQNLNSPNLGVATGTEYFNEQLHNMRLDPNQAAAIWQKVLLFRRLFHDMGSSMFVDPMTIQQFNQYVKETIEGDLYRMPREFHFNHFRDMQKFEIYLNAISNRNGEQKSLTLPTAFLSVEEVAKKSPELVQKRYLLDIAQVEKKTLQSKISLKDTWNWEVEDQNWPKLVKQFPDLGIKKGETREQRFQALDSLDDMTRTKVDDFARNEMMESHPEWVAKALDDAPAIRTEAALKLKGGKTPFAGLTKPQTLISLLDNAKIGEPDPSLSKFTADNASFYRIIVLERTPAEILTFAEAQKEGVLDPLLDAQLENYYNQIKQNYPQDFQKEDKTWKNFADVKERVAEIYFAPLLQAIYQEYTASISPEKPQKQLLNEISASLRFNAYARQILAEMKKNPNKIETIIKQKTEGNENEKLPAREPLTNQWKFEKSVFHYDRASKGQQLDLKEGFSLKPEEWSMVHTPANGDIFFFQLASKEHQEDKIALNNKIDAERQLLSEDAEHQLMNHLLNRMKEKHALSLDYLNKGSEMSPEG